MVDFLDRWLNFPLLKSPMNWAIVAMVATLWLLAFHVVMQAWGAMVAPTPPASFGAAPGQINVPSVNDPAQAFSIQGNNGSTGMMDPNFVGGVTSVFTDGFESKYAEDGWVGNP